jgi:hypothetical protein
VSILIWLALALTGAARAQQTPNVAPRIDERVAQIAQTAPGAPWAFIGYAIVPPWGVPSVTNQFAPAAARWGASCPQPSRTRPCWCCRAN